MNEFFVVITKDNEGVTQVHHEWFTSEVEAQDFVDWASTGPGNSLSFHNIVDFNIASINSPDLINFFKDEILRNL